MRIGDGGFGPSDPLAPALTLPEAPWDNELSDILVCQSVREETPDVKTFVLKPLVPGRFRYQPGQFMTYA
ncbi:MAG TPA: hypothetical protein VGB81_11895, partial [Devosia sp.]